MITVDLIEAGNAVHCDVDRLMIGLQEQRIDDKIPDTLIFVEHPEIVTIGRRGMLAVSYTHLTLPTKRIV